MILQISMDPITTTQYRFIESITKHLQLYRMVPSTLKSYNRQNLYAPSIDDILAFATYINVHDIDIFLRRNRNAHYKHIRKSALALYSSDIELVVRKEDSTSNRRLSSLNFNLSLSLSLSEARVLRFLLCPL